MIPARWRVHVELGGIGLLLGAAVSATGLSDFGELHRMFTFGDVRLLLTFAGAVVLSGVGFRLWCQGAPLPSRPLRAGTIPGAVLFGAGWALCGGCPAAVLAMLGEGRVPALAVLGGILGGTLVGNRVKGKIGLDSGSCSA